MNVSLLPRLNPLGVSAILKDSEKSPPTSDKALQIVEQHSAYVTFAASGGSQDFDLVGEISRVIKEIAQNHGFPEQGSQASRAAFDTDLAISLSEIATLGSGEALRDDAWAFLTLVMNPDVVAWRYPDRPKDRYEGGVRNTFQRLWIRGVVLDRGAEHNDRWALVREINEDGLVQIFERASVAGNARLARAIAEGWLRTAGRIGKGRMEKPMRDAVKMLRIRNEVIDLAYLEEAELEREIDGAFTAVTAHLEHLAIPTQPQSKPAANLQKTPSPRSLIGRLFGS